MFIRAVEIVRVAELQIRRGLKACSTQHRIQQRTRETQNSPVIHGPSWLALSDGWDSAGQAVAAAVRRCWKHSRQKTGRPWLGLNGTVVSLPQPEQFVRVSTLG